MNKPTQNINTIKKIIFIVGGIAILKHPEKVQNHTVILPQVP
jgi:hypothetical protein